ncbi:MAG TPA: AAA family ATPase [Dehalococcoidia bacterium]|nr:AAA family ATPase [Dehalococcoidia bacterium]
MAKQSKARTAFGKDLDSLLKRAGKLTIREYADECGVNYKYISQLRTMPNRRPAGVYAHLLKPFVRLRLLDVTEGHQLSMRHRGRPLSHSECRELFPSLPDYEILESIKQAVETRHKKSALRPRGQRLAHAEVGSPQPEEASPLYRKVFVGREAELKQFQSAFNAAVSGNGSLVAAVGEPGIGKTAICEQLSTYATLRGGSILVGHCYGEGTLSLPYLPFIEAIRGYVLTHDTDDVKKEMAVGAADIARIVGEVTERLKVEPRTQGDPQEERYRLMQAVANFLTNAAIARPLVLVLEDLHDADMGTLDMLTYVARNLAGTRVMLVVTYRDIGLDGVHPLSATLAELHRVAYFDRVPLRGLSIDEVRTMLENVTGGSIPLGLTQAVYRQTEGNPLFVQEVVRYLVEEGIISQEKGQWHTVAVTPLETRIPEGLRGIIEKRLSSLSQECNEILSVAAVIGREFSPEVLRLVTNMSDEDLFTALEKAKSAAVIEERAGVGAAITYRFGHAFFRQALYEEIIAPRRILLHQRVARALEEIYAAHPEDHATELAEHFSHSSDRADLTKAVSYGQMAAQQATDVYAYGEAVRLLEQTLKVQEILDPEDKAKRCDLLLTLGNALIWAGQPRRVVDETAPLALTLAEDIGDNNRASKVCLLAGRALIYYGSGPALGSPEFALWSEKADYYAQPDTIERAWADMFMGTVKRVERDYKSGRALLRRALDLARRLNEPSTLFMTARFWLWGSFAPQHAREAFQLVQEIERWSMQETDIAAEISLLLVVRHLYLVFGYRRKAEEVASQIRELAERIQQTNNLLVARLFDAHSLYMDGGLEDALAVCRDVAKSSRGMGLEAFMGTYLGMVTGRIQIYLGHAEKESQARVRWSENTGYTLDPVDSILYLAHLGRNEEVNEILEREVVSRAGIETDWEEMAASSCDHFLEAAVLTGHRSAAALLQQCFADSGMLTSGQFSPTIIPRHLGAAAALLGRPEEARDHYQEAMRVCTEMRFRPELALTRLQLAELILEHYPDEKSETLEHLDFAINEFREMRMQPSLERALRHKEILGV